MKNANSFSLSMRLMHWSMAALLLSMLLAGTVMIKSLAVWQPTLLMLHKSFGVVALLLVVVRIVLRFTSRIPALPSSVSAGQKTIARASHVALYGLMFAMPLTGLIMQYYAARPISIFNLIVLNSAATPNITLFAIFRLSHGYLAYALLALVCMHALAALYHHFVRKDDVLKSML